MKLLYVKIFKERGNMANKKTVGKTSKKVTINFDWNQDKKSNNKSNKKVEKQIKKLGVGILLLAAVFLVFGAVGGFFAVKFVSKNDCFILNGKDEITLQIGEKYTDEGAKVIAFGKNDENKLKVETKLKEESDGVYYAEEEGTYYIIYTVDNFKYGTLFKIQKIRLITFVEATEQEEISSANQGGNT